jgi:uncharacterized protein (TIGR02246 family)
MNWFQVAPLFLTMSLSLAGGEPPVAPTLKPDPAILSMLDDYFAAVNAMDPSKFLTFFTQGEALTVIEDKDLRLSRQAFEAYIDDFFKGVSQIQATWETRTIHPLGPGQAVVTGTFKVKAKDAKGGPMAFRNAFTFVLVQREGRWRVKHVHESSLDL